MRASFAIFKTAAARILLLLTAGLSSVAVFSAHARPIEFSAPSDSQPAASVSELSSRPADLPGVEDRVLKPHDYLSQRGLTYNPSAQSAPVLIRKNPVPSLFDRDQNWMQLTPQHALQKMIERDTLKLPSSEMDNNFSDAWSRKTSWVRPDGVLKKKSFSGASLGENNSDSLNMKDPFAAYSERSASFGGLPVSDLNEDRTRNLSELAHSANDLSPEVLHAQKEMADHLDEFKRTLNTPGAPAPALNPAVPAPPVFENAYVSQAESFSRTPGGKINPMFVAPVAPVVRQAPLAPGQTSLTPSTYSPPARLKPVVVTVPRREF